MIIDYKYHIASLVAVFLALGIGILIGSTLLGNDALVEYQKQVTDRLESQLQSLREANEAIQARANTLELDASIHKQFEKRVLPALVAGRLAGKKFAVVELNNYGYPPELIEVLEKAGGEVTSVTAVKTPLNDSKLLAELVGELQWQGTADEKLVTKLATEIACGIVSGENRELFQYLQKRELVRTNGQFGIPVDGVIIVGGDYKETKRDLQFDLALIDYFKELNITVLGVEETDVAYSTMKDYQRKQISTVDNIDTAPGQLAVVLALSGQPGNYGIKPSARMLLPEIKMQETEKGVK